MESRVAIKVENLNKNYKTDAGMVTILHDINLEINDGDFCIIYGPSGCGKSTLLHHIAGLETPTSGQVFIKGTNLNHLNGEQRGLLRAAKIGMVYQLWYWVKSLRVWENVALPLLIGGVGDREARHRAIKVLEEFGLSKYMNLRPTQLSGGEQQRVGLARALINNPWIILADEPTGNLDTHASDQIIDILQDLNVNKKRTVVMVTHNPAYDQLANVKIEMRDGRIIKELR